MRRYVSNLFLVLVASLFAVSCVNEMELSEPLFGDDAITLVPHVKSFANQYVTKAGTGESDIKSMTVLVFNNLGNYVYSETVLQGASLVLNKSLLAQGGAMDKATIVLIANASLSKFKTYSDSNGWESISERPTLAQFQGASFIYEDAQTVLTSLPDTGLPMIGLTTEANLTPTGNTGTIQVDLQILYAKVNFSISVANGGENEGTGMKFVMSGYTINNVAKVTPVKAPKEKEATAYTDYAYTRSSAASSASGTTTPTSNPVTFTFYVAETRYNPATYLTGVYPSDSWLSTTLYDHLKQQYKPKVAIKEGEGVAPAVGYATYVTLKGSYTDYRGTDWTVNYQVYLGKDNATNFQVDRNSEYTNYVVIKGIRNNREGGTNDVWVDHRVVVSTDDVAASYVNITRETLIDSHIEVRPLRVQWEEGKYYCVRLYLPTNLDGTLVDWIGVERFTGENCQGTSQYCYQNNKSIGKRKYFTQNLIAELQENEGEFGIQTDDKQRKYITLLNKECAWIYFDENTTDYDRPADIKLDFIAYDGSTTIEEYTYKVTQQCLSTVSIKNADNTESKLRYESYEEYLHSYDPIDQYDLSTSPYDYTKQGLEWGLNEVPLSSEYVVSAAPLDPLVVGLLSLNFIERGWMDDISSRYDYFHKNDAPSGNSYYTYTKSNGNWERLSCGTGLDFTERASSRAKITVEDMARMPTSAYQYCLSKNKFKADEEGNVEMTVNWYLPDVYELQAVLTKIKEEAVPGDFVTDAFYWSSQPSRNSTTLANLPLIGQYLGDIDFAAENNANARAVSLSKDGTVTVQNTSRTTPNRIRCLYSPTGKPTDMEGRTPEGIGGKVTFVMKAYDGSQPAHFNDFLSETTETTISKKTETTIVKGDEPYTNETFAWPTFTSDAAKLQDFGFFNDREDADGRTITGFSENPAESNSWEKFLYLQQVTDYYTTLYNFPGLHTMTMEKHFSGNAYKPTNTRKSKTVKVADIKANSYSGEISGESRSLDGLRNITFATHTLQENNSRFEYSAYVPGSKEQVTTSYWKVPKYEMVSLDENNPVSYSKTYVATYKEYIDGLGAIGSLLEGLEPKALAAAKRMAMDEYPDYIYSYGQPTYKTDYGNEGSFFRPKYYAQVTCTLSVSISNFYYQNPDGGGWDDANADTETKLYDGVQHDELRMFSGNSFTISLSEEYKKTHEIVSVKVYYSGDNKMKSFTDGNILDGVDNPYDIYARFVASNVELPSQQSTPPQLVGMDYHEESNGTGWQMWSGNGTATITMNLMDYVVTKPYVETGIGNLGDYSYLYRDIKTSGNDASNLTKHIVIDKIEIRCVPKSTTQSE